MNNVLGFLSNFLVWTGIIIGWMNLVSDVSTFIAAIFGIVFLSIYDCTDLKKVVERVGGTATDAEFDSICSFGRIRK